MREGSSALGPCARSAGRGSRTPGRGGFQQPREELRPRPGPLVATTETHVGSVWQKQSLPEG